MSDIDWSQAPEGATHAVGVYQPNPWRKFVAGGDYWHDGARWRVFCRDPEHDYIARPPVSDGPLRAEEFDHLLQPDDLAVDAFAQAMVRRLEQCRDAGKSGWDDPEQCPPQRLAEGLVRAVRAGKLVDVGNYAMMLWNRIGNTGTADYLRDVFLKLNGVALQPESVEWDGTGLPPVGTVCEWRGTGGSWEQANIAAHVTKRSGTSFVLFELANDYWHWESDPKRLRPVLTPEQRAAKERDEAVAAMLAVPEVFHDAQTMQALYAAGWRKTEGE